MKTIAHQAYEAYVAPLSATGNLAWDNLTLSEQLVWQNVADAVIHALASIHDRPTIRCAYSDSSVDIDVTELTSEATV